MSRHAKFALFVGLQVSWVLAAIYALGFLIVPDTALARALGLPVEAEAKLVNAHAFLQYAAILALAFGIAWTTVDLRRPLARALIAAGAVTQMFTCCGLLALFGIYFSPFLPALAGVLAFAAGAYYARSGAGRRRDAVDAVFAGRVSPETAHALATSRVGAADPVAATSLAEATHGHVRELTLVICEIFNHAALLDTLSAADYLRLTNAFLDRAADALVRAGGCLVSCNGEGVTAFFGAPLPGQVHSHAVLGCRAALEVARRVRALNESWHQEFDGEIATTFPGCDVRIGINSGEMIAGRFGPAPGTLDTETADAAALAGYGVAGDEVAFARRLCAANLIYGSVALIGARTYELAESAMEARPLELLRRRVGGDWLEVYELLGEPHELSETDQRRRELFWTGVIFFRERRLDEALDHFLNARALDENSADGPLDFYIRRIENLRQQDPSEEWETTRMLNAL
ncbi:MAG: adenylate/guanylate cyclase domain-containing protein [Verrucomicrobia bacterium]|nr:adenylate/guanylate cyclase domain-containing protein [Verrucomicrobiota bacterium]